MLRFEHLPIIETKGTNLKEWGLCLKHTNSQTHKGLIIQTKAREGSRSLALRFAAGMPGRAWETSRPLHTVPGALSTGTEVMWPPRALLNSILHPPQGGQGGQERLLPPWDPKSCQLKKSKIAGSPMKDYFGSMWKLEWKIIFFLGT